MCVCVGVCVGLCKERERERGGKGVRFIYLFIY